MSNDQVIAMLYYGGIALVFALGLVFVQAFVIDAESRIGRHLTAAILPAITLGIMLSVVLGGRNLKYAMLDARTIGGQIEEGGSLFRMLTVFLLSVAFAKIFGGLAKTTTAPRTTQPANEHRTLFVAMVAFFICTVPLPAIFGTRPVFIHNTYYAFILFAGVYMARHEPLTLLLPAAKWVLALMMIGSLLLLPVKPDLVAVSDYSASWIPGFKIRLWGLTSNANSIGPLALTLLLLEALHPTRNRLLKLILVGAGLAALLLSQSKTTWAGALISGGVVMFWRWGRDPRGGIRIGVVLALIFLAAVLMSSLLFVDAGQVIDRLGNTRVGTDIGTLTGRAQVWAAALQIWEDSPFFGYGPLAWGPEHRMALGLTFAFHAHNQFMQSLSAAGIFGAVSLLIYFVLLVRASWRAAGRTRGISLGLMTLIAMRCVSEAPLDMTGAVSGETIMHLLLFMLVINEAPAERPNTVAG